MVPLEVVSSRPGLTQVIGVEMRVIEVNPARRWFLVRLRTSEGLVGLGEGTLDPSDEQPFCAALEALLPAIMDTPFSSAIDLEEQVLRNHCVSNLTEAAAHSALEHALWDLTGRQRRLPVHELLGGKCRDTVCAYANINRALTGERSPHTFGRRLRQRQSRMDFQRSSAPLLTCRGSTITRRDDSCGWSTKDSSESSGP